MIHNKYEHGVKFAALPLDHTARQSIKFIMSIETEVGLCMFHAF